MEKRVEYGPCLEIYEKKRREGTKTWIRTLQEVSKDLVLEREREKELKYRT